MSLSRDKKGRSEMSIGMRIHDKTRRYSSAQSRKTKACRAGAHTAGTRNAGMGGASVQNASMHSAQDHLDACGGWTRKGMSATVMSEVPGRRM